MKYPSMILAASLLLFAAACDDDSPANPSEDITFTAALTSAAEVPFPNNTENTGSGNVTVVLSVTRDSSSNITSATANFQVGLTGFPSTTNFTMAHIHEAPVGVAGPIVVDTGLPSGSVVLTNGVGAFTRNPVNVPTTTAAAMINNAAAFYFNVHSTLNAPGVVRGQLVKQ